MEIWTETKARRKKDKNDEATKFTGLLQPCWSCGRGETRDQACPRPLAASTGKHGLQLRVYHLKERIQIQFLCKGSTNTKEPSIQFSSSVHNLTGGKT